MGGERRSHGDTRFLQVQDACTRLPLVELGNDFFAAREVVVPEALNHLAGDDTEYGRLFIIPVAGDGVYAVVPPHPAKNVVGLRQEGLVVYQNGNGLAGNIPSAYTETEPLRSRLGFPGTVQPGVFQKIRVAGTVHPYIRADKNVMPSQLFTQIEGLGGDNRIDAAYLVTDLPAYFK